MSDLMIYSQIVQVECPLSQATETSKQLPIHVSAFTHLHQLKHRIGLISRYAVVVGFR